MSAAGRLAAFFVAPPDPSEAAAVPAGASTVDRAVEPAPEREEEQSNAGRSDDDLAPASLPSRSATAGPGEGPEPEATGRPVSGRSALAETPEGAPRASGAPQRAEGERRRRNGPASSGLEGPGTSTDGSSARRLAPHAEPRPSLRLVPSPHEGPDSSSEADTGCAPARDVRRPGSHDEPHPTGGAEPAMRPPDTAPDRPRGRGTDGDPGAARVCLLGDGRSAVGFARGVAGELARTSGARCAVLGHMSTGLIGTTPAVGRPAARRLARALEEDGLRGKARGRVVEVALADPPGAVTFPRAEALSTPVVLLLPATRAEELDVLLDGHDVILLVTRPGAPPALTALAVADLERFAPGSEVRAITLPVRGGGGARRAALNDALGILR